MLTDNETKAINAIRNGKLPMAIAFLRLQIEINYDQQNQFATHIGQAAARDVVADIKAHEATQDAVDSRVAVPLPPRWSEVVADDAAWASDTPCQRCGGDHHEDNHDQEVPTTWVRGPGDTVVLRAVQDVPESHAPTTCDAQLTTGVVDLATGVPVLAACGQVINWTPGVGWRHIGGPTGLEVPRHLTHEAQPPR